MKRRFFVFALASGFLIAAATRVRADSLSLTGALATPESTRQQTFTLASLSSVSIQSWGFGGTNGGHNAAGNPIAAGGFDPLLALFSGSGASASIYNIGGDPNDPAGSSDTLSNFAEFYGCPPAGTVSIGGPPAVCGDLSMNFTLAAGTYTLLIADANYQPNALIMPGASTLGDGFTDFTGGAFQTCNGTDCINTTGDYAVDLVSPGLATSTPEPLPLLLLGTGLICAGGWMRRRIQ